MALTEDEKKVLELEEALEKERNTYTEKLNDLIPMIRNIDKIAEAQVLMLSYRHMFVDKMSRYKSATYKKKASDQNYKKMRYEYYKTHHDVRLDFREINEFISSDMSLRIRQTDLLENQISFCSQCIDTLDRMGFAIKNRITVEEINNRLT